MNNHTDPNSPHSHDRLEQIELLARSYWELEGRPDGRHLEHWLRAEAELAGQDSNRTGVVEETTP